MKQKNDLKKLEKDLDENSISLKKFLILYCGISASSLDNIRLSHNDIKILMPNLKRSSFEYLLNNMKNLYVGKVIAVKDAYGVVLPYVCPKIEEISNPTIIANNNNELGKIEINKDLKLYQLCLLSKKLKKFKKYREYRNATKLIKTKVDYKAKQYKKEKKFLIEREKENEY